MRATLVIFWIAITAIVGTPAGAADLPAARADCPFDPARYPAGREIRGEISRLAELVAPSAANSGKRHVVAPPVISYPPNRNFIDAEIFGKMKGAGIVPASLSGDAEFLRRLT